MLIYACIYVARVYLFVYVFKIAFDAYGDTRYWYLIAWWNQKPADFYCKPGDIIYIPRPLKDILQLWNKEK